MTLVIGLLGASVTADTGEECAREVYSGETGASLSLLRGELMKSRQRQSVQIQSSPVPGWYLRWLPWIVSGFVCTGYLSGVLTTRPLTPLSLLLLTGIYGAWLIIYHTGARQFKVARPHPGFVLA